jgi:hypothetical protein
VRGAGLRRQGKESFQLQTSIKGSLATSPDFSACTRSKLFKGKQTESRDPGGRERNAAPALYDRSAKPLLTVGSKSVLELALRWVSRNGTRDIYIAGNLYNEGLSRPPASYILRRWEPMVSEDHLLRGKGTARSIGALSLLREELDETFLVINGGCVDRRHEALMPPKSIWADRCRQPPRTEHDSPERIEYHTK